MSNYIEAMTAQSAGSILVMPDSEPLSLSANARAVLTRRYLRKGAGGEPVETPEEMFRRVARTIAQPEGDYGDGAAMAEEAFYRLLTSLRFFPNSPTFTGAGTPLGQLAACFVIPISDDMGRRSDGIFQTLRDAALIQQTGGGNGFSFSRLRPKGSLVKSSSGQATGALGFLRVYDQAFGEIAQGGSRRGANMGVLRVDHPDIEEFITCKTDENQITNFNISVGITDAFMQAVKRDDWWELRFPDVSVPGYGDFSGTLGQAERAGLPIKVHKQMRARELFDKIVRQAHHNGEPGVLFLDAANCSNPVSHLYELEATNPCGEQHLGPYESCCLGSINLAQHVRYNNGRAEVDWARLEESVVLAAHFLDNVVTVNKYVPSVPQLKEAALRCRRIGLGIMGLADMMYHLGIRYGSQEAQEFAGQVMEFVRYHAMLTSVELARQRGPFPAIEGSLYDPADLKWGPPTPLVPYTRDWGRPPVNWDTVVSGIKRHGIRNAAQTTIAPTGTVGTVAGCEGYGCEPVFALAYVRHVDDNGQDLQLTYASPLFEQALARAGLSEEARQEIYEEVMLKGSCQDVAGVPEPIRRAFVVSQDITPEDHVRMQAALQRFVDNSISKTTNLPATASVDDVARAYFLAWELGCKGLTVYVTGSREKAVLETQATRQAQKQKGQKQIPLPLLEAKKPRPKVLPGITYRMGTPLGTTFVTINENGDSEPFEVFMNTSKAGSETQAVSEAMGRLISYILRLASPVSPTDRLKEVVKQLSGIGGGRPMGFGPNRVLSLPDGVAQVLAEYLGMHGGNGQDDPRPRPQPSLPTFKLGDLCPDCGQAALVREEGCRKCYTCGYSEC